jgi:hypothetical protein
MKFAVDINDVGVVAGLIESPADNPLADFGITLCASGRTTVVPAVINSRNNVPTRLNDLGAIIGQVTLPFGDQFTDHAFLWRPSLTIR